MLLGWTVQPSASAPRTARPIAAPFATGSAPGSPRQTGHTCVLGGAPNAVEQPQNILERVRSCTCVSSPMIVSQLITLRPSPGPRARARTRRSEEHTSELQSLAYLVCRLLLEKKKHDNDIYAVP